MILHVRNFGKIESADIDLGNLTIFVGENNSGKTYLMQLIYGLFSIIYQNKEFHKYLGKQHFFDVDFNNNFSFTIENKEFMDNFQNVINGYLMNNKEKLIENIFHTKNLFIESLSVDIDISDEFSIEFSKLTTSNGVKYKFCHLSMNNSRFQSLRFADTVSDEDVIFIGKRDFLRFIISKNISSSFFNATSYPFLYLPASRSGIMLLYANYLTNESNNNIEEKVDVIYEESSEIIENEYGLTTPVYDFLMFLLKHKDRELIDEKKSYLLSFINENIINGSLIKVGNTMRYIPNASESSIPIYLSSSLVSELAPICQIISGINNIEYVLYDEIETCQHPTKQRELARLLIRMVNAGYKMIVSTHSDTMAAAINNLITLSYKKNSQNLAEELGYTKDDLLVESSVRAYQFMIDESTGKTKVKEIPSHFSLGIGFDFKIFNKTNDKIYQDAVRLAEVD